MIVHILLPFIVGSPNRALKKSFTGCTRYLMGTKILDYIKLFHKPSTQEYLRLLQLHVAEDMFLLLCVYACIYGYIIPI